MYLVINKWVIAVNVSDFSGQYLRKHWTLDIGVLGYIGIVWPKEHSPEVWSVPPVTPCILIYHSAYHRVIFIDTFIKTGENPIKLIEKILILYPQYYCSTTVDHISISFYNFIVYQRYCKT